MLQFPISTQFLSSLARYLIWLYTSSVLINPNAWVMWIRWELWELWVTFWMENWENRLKKISIVYDCRDLICNKAWKLIRRIYFWRVFGAETEKDLLDFYIELVGLCKMLIRWWYLWIFRYFRIFRAFQFDCLQQMDWYLNERFFLFNSYYAFIKSYFINLSNGYIAWNL